VIRKREHFSTIDTDEHRVIRVVNVGAMRMPGRGAAAAASLTFLNDAAAGVARLAH
jgi:hypothetical protein